MKIGMTQLGNGDAYKEHKGKSNHIKDAIIIDFASTYADVFVSNDRRSRERLKEINTSCLSKTYSEFEHMLKTTFIDVSG